MAWVLPSSQFGGTVLSSWNEGEDKNLHMHSQAIAVALSFLHPKGGVCECRMFGTPKGTVSGYFDNFYDLACSLDPWHGKTSIYITINRLKPDLLARACNRLRPYAHVTTAAEDVLVRQWFPVDVDSVRPRGIPANDQELQAALARRDQVGQYLAQEGGYPPHLPIMSGNGGWGLWRVDLPNTEEVNRVYQQALKALDQRFSDGPAKVDPAVHSATQLMKLWTTLAVKGDAIRGRPHRRVISQGIPAHLVEGPQLVTLDQLRWLASQARSMNATYSFPAPSESPNLVDLFKAKELYRRPLP
jgi:hypothetical protein